MNFGLPPKSLQMIIDAISAFPEIEQALIFGSRAIGNYKKGSDVDLAIAGQKVNHLIENRLSSRLNETLPLPYYFDVVDYTHLTHPGLKEHIDKHAIPLNLATNKKCDRQIR